ncbi:MAG: hypothetical protein ACRDHF_12415 [Tepidiformaceae bacterium]
MASSITTQPLAQVKTPLLAIALPQGSALPPSLADVDRAAGGALARAWESGDVKGKKDDTLLVYGAGSRAAGAASRGRPPGATREGSTPSSGTVVASGRRRHA